MTSDDIHPSSLEGEIETQSLEFKASAALEKPAGIAREVVAMLNSGGGSIWIGVPEVNGRATTPETIPNVDTARESLRNHLLDTIEPCPTDEEIRCSTVDGVIKITVTSDAPRRPYAVLKDQGRQFWLRVDNIVRPMTRDQIAEAFGNKDRGDPDEIGLAKKRLEQAFLDEYRLGRKRFWWQLVPAPRFAIDSRDQEAKDFLQKILTDPQRSGNRRNGWSVVFFHDRLPKGRSDGGIRHTFGEGKNEHIVDIAGDGTMTFAVPRVRLDRNWNEDGSELFPFALLEFPVSAFRLASQVIQRFGSKTIERGRMVCTAALCDVVGTTLRPGSPNEPALPWKHLGKPRDDKAVVNLMVQTKELVANPDAAAYQLVWAIYEQFQLEEEDIPSEFDRKDKVLRFK